VKYGGRESDIMTASYRFEENRAMSNKEQDVIREAAQKILAATSPVVVVWGTHMRGKLPASLVAMLWSQADSKHRANAVVMVPTLKHLERFLHEEDFPPLNDFWTQLIRKREIRVKGLTVALNSIRSKPEAIGNIRAKLGFIVVYPSESFKKCVKDLLELRQRLNEKGRLVLATWTDNQPDIWMRGLNPEYVVLHNPNPGQHKSVLDNLGWKKETDYFEGSPRRPSIKARWQLAFDRIRDTVNLSGLHSSDEAKIAQVLGYLRENSLLPDEEELYAYLISTYWPEHPASYPRDICKKMRANPSYYPRTHGIPMTREWLEKITKPD